MVLLVLLGVITFRFSVAAPIVPGALPTINFYKLALQWPQSICNQQTAESGTLYPLPTGVTGWTIHGLWPSIYGHGLSPDFCLGPALNFTELAPATGAMETLWPCMHTDSNNSYFWSHEWQRHGVCALAAGDVSSQLDYFVWTLHMALLYDPERALTAAGVVPRRQPYSREVLLRVLATALPARFELVCVNNTSRWELAELRVCLDRLWRPADCFHGDEEKGYKVHGCGSEVYYPPLLPSTSTS